MADRAVALSSSLLLAVSSVAFGFYIAIKRLDGSKDAKTSVYWLGTPTAWGHLSIGLALGVLLAPVQWSDGDAEWAYWLRASAALVGVLIFAWRNLKHVRNLPANRQAMSTTCKQQYGADSGSAPISSYGRQQLQLHTGIGVTCFVFVLFWKPVANRAWLVWMLAACSILIGLYVVLLGRTVSRGEQSCISAGAKRRAADKEAREAGSALASQEEESLFLAAPVASVALPALFVPVPTGASSDRV